LATTIDTRLTLPTDVDLDEFDSGVVEVDDYFQQRQWFNTGKGKAAPPTYTFLEVRTSEVIGYAALVFKNLDHPCDGAGSRAKYLTVYVAGVNLRFQGVENPQSPGENYAESVFGAIDELARTKQGCVGLSLWVREDNLRALAFYRKSGFDMDPSGPVQRDAGARHVTMRKLFQA
jgi:Acetyltransferase (GNAT) family